MTMRADAISAKAHMRAAHVKAAVAAGRSQNKIARLSVYQPGRGMTCVQFGIAILGGGKEA
jgi:hypothetical protein